VGASIRAGTWCPICSPKGRGKKRRLTIEEMQGIAKKRGGKCVSKRYKDAKTKLKWECKCGNVWDATPQKIKQGRWCPVCGRKKRWETRRKNDASVA